VAARIARLARSRAQDCWHEDVPSVRRVNDEMQDHVSQAHHHG
jgi:hypothetical protein